MNLKAIKVLFIYIKGFTLTRVVNKSTVLDKAKGAWAVGAGIASHKLSQIWASRVCSSCAVAFPPRSSDIKGRSATSRRLFRRIIFHALSSDVSRCYQRVKHHFTVYVFTNWRSNWNSVMGCNSYRCAFFKCNSITEVGLTNFSTENTKKAIKDTSQNV